MNRAVLALVLFACLALLGCIVGTLLLRPTEHRERIVVTPVTFTADAGPAPLGDIYVAPSNAVRFEMHGPDFEDARGKGCPLEAVVEQRVGGQVLRFRCAVYGGP